MKKILKNTIIAASCLMMLGSITAYADTYYGRGYKEGAYGYHGYDRSLDNVDGFGSGYINTYYDVDLTGRAVNLFAVDGETHKRYMAGTSPDDNSNAAEVLVCEVIANERINFSETCDCVVSLDDTHKIRISYYEIESGDVDKDTRNYPKYYKRLRNQLREDLPLCKYTYEGSQFTDFSDEYLNSLPDGSRIHYERVEPVEGTGTIELDCPSPIIVGGKIEYLHNIYTIHFPDSYSGDTTSTKQEVKKDISLPDYVVKGTWANNNNAWTFTDEQGNPYRNKWGAVYNPYAPADKEKFDWFFFDENGNMKTGWLEQNGKWFYLNPNSDGTRGAMVTGEQYIDGKGYVFSDVSNGSRGMLIR